MGVLQMDLGGAGAWMRDEVVDACLRQIAGGKIAVVELGGEAPELHPRFREVVILARALRRRVIAPARLAAAEGALAELLAEQEVDLQSEAWTPAFGPTIAVAPDGAVTECEVSPSLAHVAPRVAAGAPDALGAGAP